MKPSKNLGETRVFDNFGFFNDHSEGYDFKFKKCSCIPQFLLLCLRFTYSLRLYIRKGCNSNFGKTIGRCFRKDKILTGFYTFEFRSDCQYCVVCQEFFNFMTNSITRFLFFKAWWEDGHVTFVGAGEYKYMSEPVAIMQGLILSLIGVWHEGCQKCIVNFRSVPTSYDLSPVRKFHEFIINFYVQNPLEKLTYSYGSSLIIVSRIIEGDEAHRIEEKLKRKLSFKNNINFTATWGATEELYHEVSQNPGHPLYHHLILRPIEEAMGRQSPISGSNENLSEVD